MSKLKKITLLCFVLFSVMFLFSACDFSNSSAAIFAINVTQSTGGFVSPNKQLAEPGETVTLTVKTEAGYRLSLLAYNSIILEGNTFEMPKRNVEITARFDAIYNVRIVNSDGGTITVDKKQAVAGETVKVSVALKENYQLEAILVNGGEIDGDSFVMSNENAIVSARYKCLTHEVNVNQTTGGLVLVDKSLATKDEIVTVNVIEDAGYKLSLLTYNSVLMTGNTFVMPDRDVVVQAKFVRVYDVTTNSDIEVELKGQGKYAEGEKVILKADEVDNYRFIGWEFNNEIVSNDLEYKFTLNLNNHGIYKAVYEKLFTIEIDDSITYGSVDAQVTNAINNEQITLTVTPNEDYELSRLWYSTASEEVEITGNTFEMPEENIVIHAIFAHI